jgi:hypothetical protein
VNSAQLSWHLQKSRYGDFWLTDAIRPALRQPVIPRSGYRVERYQENGLHIPVLAAAVSREKLFDTFLEMISLLDDEVDVILETSHDGSNQHRDLQREQIDLPVLQSHLCDYEDLLLHDGCTGIAVLSSSRPVEIQFDEHKLLIVYAEDLEPFEACLSEAGVPRLDGLKLITEGEHLHNTTPRYLDQFEQLCMRIGVGEMAEHVNW